MYFLGDAQEFRLEHTPPVVRVADTVTDRQFEESSQDTFEVFFHSPLQTETLRELEYYCLQLQ